MTGENGMVFVSNEELLKVFSRVIKIIDQGNAEEDFKQALSLLLSAHGAKQGSSIEKIFLSVAVAYCLGKYEGDKVKKPEHGPKTKAAYIVGEQVMPDGETQREIGRIMRRYPEEPTWGGVQAYTLGFIHGKQAERARAPKYVAIKQDFERLRDYWESGSVCLIPELEEVRERYWSDRPQARTEEPETKLFLTFADGYVLGRNSRKKAHDAGQGNREPKSKAVKH